MTKIAMLLGAVLLCAPVLGHADEAAGSQGPCKADYEKFCKDVKPGHGRIIKCMNEHKDDLSAECKEKIAARKEKRQEAHEAWEKACGDDVKSLCADVKAGHGAIRKCLRENKEKLSDGCKSFMAEKKEERAERRKKKGGDEDKDEGKKSSGDKSDGDKDSGAKEDGGGSQE